MSIGKNAIKRVENNGYSKVESKAPDMENSSVIANLDPQVMEKLVAPVEEQVAVAQAPAKPKQTKKPACKKTVAEKKVPRVEVGQSMPYYLL